jgi:hypothetical protein
MGRSDTMTCPTTTDDATPEYTPTTEEVETHWADVGFASDRASFRRWLAEIERAAAEKAWDEGEQAGYEDALGEQRGIGPAESARNPYQRNEGENK